jgi:polar amino acid transport system substrate-binding protein
MVLAAALAVGAYLEAADDPRIADLLKAQSLRLALDLGNPLLAVQDPITLEYRGVTVGLATALAARIGVPLRVVPYTKPPEIIFVLQQKAVDAGVLAVDPARVAAVDFSPAIVEVDNAYLVSPGSAIHEVGGLDASGVRIAVVTGYGADLFLTRVLKRASVVRSATPSGALDLVITGRADAMAGHLPTLRALAPRLPRARLLVDRFIAESYALAVPKGQAGWLAYVTELVTDARASGMVSRAIAELGLVGIRVAPPPRRPAPRDSGESASLRPDQLEPARSGSDVDMGSGGFPAHGAAERHEGDTGGAQEGHELRAFGAVRRDRDVDRVAVIEAQAVVDGRLSEGADGEGPAEATREEVLDLGRLGEGPVGGTAVLNEERRRLVPLGRGAAGCGTERGRRLDQRLGERVIGDDHLAARARELGLGDLEHALAVLELPPRNDPARQQVAPFLDLRGRAVHRGDVKLREALEGRPVGLDGGDQVGAGRSPRIGTEGRRRDDQEDCHDQQNPAPHASILTRFGASA